VNRRDRAWLETDLTFMAELYETDVMTLTEEAEVEKARLAIEEIWRAVNMAMYCESGVGSRG